MDTNKQREIASKGGKAAHAKGTAHQFSSDEAREAGRKGGQAVSRNREHMATIGREGGKSSRPGHAADEHPTDERTLAASSNDLDNAEAGSLRDTMS